MKDLIDLTNVFAVMQQLTEQKAQIKYEGPGFIIYQS
jgi:hypothetical protein